MSSKKLFVAATLGVVATTLIPQTDAFIGLGLIAAAAIGASIATSPFRYGLGYGYYGGYGGGYGGYGGYGGGCGCDGPPVMLISDGCGCGGQGLGQAVIFNQEDNSIIATITDEDIALLDNVGALPPLKTLLFTDKIKLEDSSDHEADGDDDVEEEEEYDEEYLQYLVDLLEEEVGILFCYEDDHFYDPETKYIYSEDEIIEILQKLHEGDDEENSKSEVGNHHGNELVRDFSEEEDHDERY